MKKIVFLFPGQGSQYVGMGKEFCENYSIVRELFEQASDDLKMDLKNLCFNGPETTLTQTNTVQPAVTLINVACLKALNEEGVVPSASAGHSLGEYTALFAAGSLNFVDLMKLVKFRGTFMQEEAEKNPGGMVAIIGLEVDKIMKLCEKACDSGSVEIANHNSPKQVIVTGETRALEKVIELADQEKAKLTIPLKVSGPWHSRFMIEARTKMEEVLKSFTLGKASFPVIANTTADYEMEPELIRTNLINQITNPVLWMSSMERFIHDGYTLFVEVGPKRVLRGLMREINKDVRIYNVENADTLKKFIDSLKSN